MNDRFVLTITRECGSRGEAVAGLAAARLGVSLYNSDIIHQAAQHYDLSGMLSTEKERTELRKKKDNFFYKLVFPDSDGKAAVRDVLFREREKVIRLVAEKENCVFLGNYSDFTLQNCPYALHAYIYSSRENRIENIMEDLQLDRNEAESMVQTADEALVYGYDTFTGSVPDDKSHKHIMIDSSVLGVEGAAELLADMVRRFTQKE